MITHLALRNWRSHAHSEFVFGKGTNVLVGDMGSGKSAAMNGICFGLFGTFPDLQQRKLKLDEIIMNKPETRDTAAVEVTFLADGKKYNVKRQVLRGKGTTKSELYENDNLIEGPNSQRVTEKVRDILKINYDLFSRAVYSEQNNVEYFLEIAKSKRKEKIDELLGILKLESARKNLGTVINRLKDRKDDREKFSVGKDEIEMMPKVKQEIDEKRKSVDAKRGELTALEKEKQEFEKGYDLISKEIKTKKQQIKDSEETMISFKTSVDRLNAVLEKNNKAFSENMKKLDELKKYTLEDEEKLKKGTDDLSNEINKLSERKGSVTSCINDIDENFGKLQGDNCPVCDSALTSEKISELQEKKKHDKEKHSQELKDIETKAEQMRKQVNEKENELVLLREKLEQRKFLDKTVVDLEKEIKSNEKELAEVKEKLEEERKKFDARSIDELKKQTEEEEKKEKEVYGKLKDAEKKTELAMQDINSVSALITEKEKRLSELEKVKSEIEKSKQEVEYLDDNVGNFQVFQKVLQQAQASLRLDFTDNLNSALSDIWRKIYPYEDYRELKLAVDDNGDYILQLLARNGEWVNVEGITSGGERSTACLVLRIALSLILAQNLSWLVLDEPTHNLDRNAVKDLAVTLKEYLPQIVDQIFIITHDEELENAASGALYKLLRNKEQDEPTRVVVENV